MSAADEQPADGPRVGARLRAVREARRMTVSELAAAAGLTKSFVSKLEREQANASVASLLRLCDALGIAIGTLFESDAGAFVAAGERPRIDFGGSGLVEHLLTPLSERRLQVIHTTIEPGGGSGAELYALPSDVEFVLVLDGALTIRLDDEERALARGDALTFSAATRHTFHNPSATRPAQVLWVCSPALPAGSHREAR